MKNPVVIIDYLDIVCSEVEPISENPYKRASHIYDELSRLAKKYNVAIRLKSPSPELEEIRKEIAAQKKIKADSENFDHFINTGEVPSKKGD